MTQTKRKESARTASRRPVSSSHAFIIGLGDGTATRELHKMGWERVITVRLPDEEMTEVPGLVYHCKGERDVGNIMDTLYVTHPDILTIGETIFFDKHKIRINETVRQTFCEEFYRVVSDKPLEFGDDILDGLQGAVHIAHNVDLLDKPTILDMQCGDVPTIAIGAGPSLTRHYDKLRQLQNKCLLICCDSILDTLLDNGINPHIVTPVERIPEIAQAFGKESYDTLWAGKPVVHPDAKRGFKNFMFVPCADILYGWCLADGLEIGSYGQSTGTMTVGLAARLTKGPIYLVGHDLSMDGEQSHCAGAKAATVHTSETFPVPGYSKTVYSDFCWDSFRRHIECTAGWHKNVYNVNAHDKIGAVIANTKSAPLPDPGALSDFTLPTPTVDHAERKERFKARLRHLPHDIKRAKNILSSIQLSPDDTDMVHLFGQSWPMFGYILRSLYAQFSYESSYGKPNQQVLAGMRDALLNVLNECDDIFKDMSSCG